MLPFELDSLSGLPRATRMVLLELCDKAIATGGYLHIDSALSLIDAVHYHIGGDKGEVVLAVHHLLGPDGPLDLSAQDGKRALVVRPAINYLACGKLVDNHVSNLGESIVDTYRNGSCSSLYYNSYVAAAAVVSGSSLPVSTETKQQLAVVAVKLPPGAGARALAQSELGPDLVAEAKARLEFAGIQAEWDGVCLVGEGVSVGFDTSGRQLACLRAKNGEKVLLLRYWPSSKPLPFGIDHVVVARHPYVKWLEKSRELTGEDPTPDLNALASRIEADASARGCSSERLQKCVEHALDRLSISRITQPNRVTGGVAYILRVVRSCMAPGALERETSGSGRKEASDAARKADQAQKRRADVATSRPKEQVSPGKVGDLLKQLGKGK